MLTNCTVTRNAFYNGRMLGKGDPLVYERVNKKEALPNWLSEDKEQPSQKRAAPNKNKAAAKPNKSKESNDLVDGNLDPDTSSETKDQNEGDKNQPSKKTDTPKTTPVIENDADPATPSEAAKKQAELLHPVEATDQNEGDNTPS